MAAIIERAMAIYAALSPAQQTVLYVVPLILSIWFYTAFMAHTSFPTIKNSNILLLIAHPDDEAMFFSPALLHLTHPSRGNVVKILCLSNGNADGIGKIREQELLKSAEYLGIKKERVVVLDDGALQDDPKATWAPGYIAHVLAHFLLDSQNQIAPPSGVTSSLAPRDGAVKRKVEKQEGVPSINTDVILTFDEIGVSTHPNHIACHYGAAHFANHLAEQYPGWRIPLAVYNLTSIAMVRKYSWVLDVPASVLIGMGQVLWTGVAGQKGRVRSRMEKASSEEKRGRPSWLLMIVGWGGYRKAQKAMYSAHQSQMRWFRWGWIGIGRYMVVNDLRRVF